MKITQTFALVLDQYAQPETIGFNGRFYDVEENLARPFAFPPHVNSAIIEGNNKTFVFYFGEDYDIWCLVKNQTTGVWASAVSVADGHTSNDTHHYASACIDGSGYIHLFYGCHDSPIYYKKSTNPYDVSAWGSESNIATYVTYPQCFVNSGGTIFVFYREGSDGTKAEYIRFRTSGDGGSSWSSGTSVAYSNNVTHYLYAGVIGLGSDDSIHLIFTDRNATGANDPTDFTGVYYAKSLDGGTTWKKSDGTGYSLPITPATAEAITGASSVFSVHLGLDGSNNPHAIYVVSDPNYYFTRCTIHHAYLSGGAWQDDTLSGSNFDYGAHIVISGTNYYVFAAQIINGTYEIVAHYSANSGSSWNMYQLTHDSGTNNWGIGVKYDISNSIELAWSSIHQILYADQDYVLDKLP